MLAPPGVPQAHSDQHSHQRSHHVGGDAGVQGDETELREGVRLEQEAAQCGALERCLNLGRERGVGGVGT
jgi:hypothetical protein